jgi:hypothetical protein
MAKNTRKKMKKMYSKKMLKSNKKNNNKYTRRPHQTRKKVFRGGGLGFPISLADLSSSSKKNIKLCKAILDNGPFETIRGEKIIRDEIVKKIKNSISINSTQRDPQSVLLINGGVYYYITFNSRSEITDIYIKNPGSDLKTQVAIVPDGTNCLPANKIINGGAPGDGATLPNQSDGVIREIQGSRGQSKSRVFKGRPVSVIEPKHINDGNVEALIRQFNTKQPATIRPPR